MLGKESPQAAANSYQRRQRVAPFIIWGLVVLLVVVGVIVLVSWFSGGKAGFNPFASPTPTNTNTPTPTPVTPTLTPTVTPSPTASPTITLTPTPSGPTVYVVLEGDNCWTIATDHKVDFNVFMTINNFGNDCPIKPGDEILIPLANQELPTETPLPTDIARGTQIEYTVKIGESLRDIASKFNSTVEAIMAIRDNNLKNFNDLKAGQKLIVPVNLVTPTPTSTATNTVTPGGPTFTATKEPTATVTPTASQ